MKIENMKVIVAENQGEISPLKREFDKKSVNKA